MIYSNSNYNEMIVIREGVEASICDRSYGSYKGYSMLRRELDYTHATELRALVLTQYHSGHETMIRLCSENLILRELYLPTPQTGDEAALAKVLWSLAVAEGTEVIFYEKDATLELTDSVRICPIWWTDEDHTPLLLSVYSSEGAWTYLSPGACAISDKSVIRERAAHSHGVIFGNHGFDSKPFYLDLSGEAAPDSVIYTSNVVAEMSRCWIGDAFAYAYREEEPYRVSFSFQDQEENS